MAKRVFIARHVLDSQRWRVRLLAEAGFHGRFIAERVSMSNHHVSVSTVYKVCKDAGIRLRDYRDGIGPVARLTLKAEREGRLKGS